MLCSTHAPCTFVIRIFIFLFLLLLLLSVLWSCTCRWFLPAPLNFPRNIWLFVQFLLRCNPNNSVKPRDLVEINEPEDSVMEFSKQTTLQYFVEQRTHDQHAETLKGLVANQQPGVAGKQLRLNSSDLHPKRSQDSSLAKHSC